MTKEFTHKKKKHFLKVSALCVIVSIAFSLLIFAYEVYFSRTKSYKESEANINKIAGQQLNKDPNELTSEDFLRLENTVVFGNDVTNLNPLVKFKYLERIDCWGFNDIDLRPLSKLKKLKWLEINFETVHRQTQSNWYDKLYSILRISRPVKNEPEPFDLDRLRKLKNLERLVLKRYPEICNIKAIESLTNLEYLTMQPNRNRIDAVIVIQGAKGKTNINYKTEPVDLSPLKKLTKLTHLNILGVKAVDYGFIEKLTNLNYLELATNNIKNIEPLGNLANLEYLGLNGTDIKDVNSLANLKNLKELNLSYTKVTDVNILKKLTGLKSLSLENIPISDDKIVELKKTLPGLRIQR